MMLKEQMIQLIDNNRNFGLSNYENFLAFFENIFACDKMFRVSSAQGCPSLGLQRSWFFGFGIKDRFWFFGQHSIRHLDQCASHTSWYRCRKMWLAHWSRCRIECCPKKSKSIFNGIPMWKCRCRKCRFVLAAYSVQHSDFLIEILSFFDRGVVKLYSRLQ